MLAMDCFPFDAVASTLSLEIERVGKIATKKTITTKVYVALWTEYMYMLCITRCNLVYQHTPIFPEV